MADRLAQGQPLTYDYLAGIEAEIDNLKNRLSRLANRINNEIEEQNITILLDRALGVNNATKPNNLQIIAGSIPIQFTGSPKPVIYQTRNFDKKFEVSPIVVASIQDPGAAAGGRNVAFATVTLGPVSTTQFSFKVEMIKSNAAIQNKDLYLNYIAIGRK